MLVWLLGAALSASAHELYPIRPVRVTLRVEPDRIVADLRADSIIWIEQVTGLHPMPVENWPPETLAKVESYANSHFLLRADGKTLPGQLTHASYRQLPWEVTEEGTFFLRLVYPPAAAGSTLSGSARFYEEYRKELESELGGRPIPFADGYRTIVSVPARKNREFTLTTASPFFTIPADEARRGLFAMTRESIRRGAAAPLEAAAGFPVLLAIALCLSAAPADFLLAVGAVAFGLALGRAVDAPPWLIWTATLIASLAVCFGRARRTAASVAAVALGVVWADAARPLLPHFFFAFPFAAAGAMLAGTVLYSVARAGVSAEYRRLAAVSESRVDELFARRARLTATALAMAGAYGLWQSFPR